ncbi:MAG: PEGA domain-containing protein, partial [Calditrichaeota bacterium]|nr:PEGA domain-containing protein [Calditrichota bacterium]
MKFQYGAGLVLGMLLLALSCTLEEGKLIVPETLYGEIMVTSDIDSARIFLDYQDSGLLTPALLEDVPVGRHVVQVSRDNYRST